MNNSATAENELSGQERIEKLFRQLVMHYSTETIASSDLDDYTGEIIDIYSNVNFRHSYAEMSLILEGFKPDERDALSANLMEISKNVETVLSQKSVSDEVKMSIQSKVFKLCDHVDLECLRLTRMDKVEYIGKTASDELSAADGKLKETEDRAARLDSRVSKQQEQSIAILGIFSGLVVTFSGAIQFASSSLENLNDISALKITYFICFSFLFLFNIIFLLMYCISKISGSSIATTCKKTSCEKCGKCKTAFGRAKKKYPYVIWFNAAGILLCFGMFIATIHLPGG